VVPVSGAEFGYGSNIGREIVVRPVCPQISRFRPYLGPGELSRRGTNGPDPLSIS
jgi:hypothetical protein